MGKERRRESNLKQVPEVARPVAERAVEELLPGGHPREGQGGAGREPGVGAAGEAGLVAPGEGLGARGCGGTSGTGQGVGGEALEVVPQVALGRSLLGPRRRAERGGRGGQ